MKQRISFEAGGPGLARGFYIRDYDFPHPVGPFGTIAQAHNWLELIRRQKEIDAKHGFNHVRLSVEPPGAKG